MKRIVAVIALIAALVLVRSRQRPFPSYVTADSGNSDSIITGSNAIEHSALTAEKTLPYFKDYICTKGLEVAKPESVNIK
jgi:hypothetical protein